MQNATPGRERPLKIGMISKPEHCGPHVAALKERGYDVISLGARPKAVPRTVDIVVFRLDSSAHAGSDVAQAVRRSGTPTVFEDGLTRIVAAVDAEAEKLRNAAAPVVAPTPIPAPAVTVSAEDKTVLQEMEDVVRIVGFYTSRMYKDETPKTIQSLIDEGLIRTSQAPQVAAALDMLRTRHERAVQKASQVLGDSGTVRRVSMYGVNMRNRVYTCNFLFAREWSKEQMEKIGRAFRAEGSGKVLTTTPPSGYAPTPFATMGGGSRSPKVKAAKAAAQANLPLPPVKGEPIVAATAPAAAPAKLPAPPPVKTAAKAKPPAVAPAPVVNQAPDWAAVAQAGISNAATTASTAEIPVEVQRAELSREIDAVAAQVIPPVRELSRDEMDLQEICRMMRDQMSKMRILELHLLPNGKVAMQKEQVRVDVVEVVYDL